MSPVRCLARHNMVVHPETGDSMRDALDETAAHLDDAQLNGDELHLQILVHGLGFD